MARFLIALCGAWFLAVAPAHALLITYPIFLTGAQEAPGPGDADGVASGTLTLNDGTGGVSWSFTYANIDAPTLMHIHGPGGPPGVAVGVYIGLGVVTTGGAGTLINSLVTATNLTAIINNPNDFYVNIHNAPFPLGAVRGQVPEPAPAVLLGLGLAALAAGGRRRRG